MVKMFFLTVQLVTVFMVFVLTGNKIEASKYNVDEKIEAQRWKGPISEGPMYPSVPIDSANPSSIEFVGNAVLGNDDSSYVGNLSLIFSRNDVRIEADDIKAVFPCEGKRYLDISNGLLQNFGEYHEIQSFKVEGGKKVDIKSKSIINKAGYQYVTFVLCSNRDTIVHVTGTLNFKSDHGYLPPLLYGFLPFSALLLSLYALLLIYYGFYSIKYCKEMLFIQGFVLITILMGLIESFAWFAAYSSMNSIGEPACCPVRDDILFAIGMNNIKRTLSALLILSTSLGWGVVKPTLELETKLKMLVLSISHFAFSLYYDMKRVSASSNGIVSNPDVTWAIPISLCDAIFAFWIYTSLTQVKQDMEQQGQHAKLEMYEKLTKSLVMWMIIWIIYAIISIFGNSQAAASASGKVSANDTSSFSWKYAYLLFGFWDFLYFGIVFSVSRIWLPSESSSAYAYSQQIPTSDTLDEFDNTAIEMSAPGNGNPTFNAGNKGAKIAPEDDDEEDEDSKGNGDGNHVKNGNGNKKIMANAFNNDGDDV